MRFLKRLLWVLEDYFRGKEISLNKVRAEEPVARFLVQKNDFNATDKFAKPRAFLPNPKNLKTSVFRVVNLTSNVIWNIGEKYVSGPRNRTLYGRADILKRNVEMLGLAVIAGGNPRS